MGSLLKETLRFLCGGGGWSYAVFWKIGRQSPTLLVWGEGYYETAKHLGLPDVSEIGSTELILKEWEALWNPSGDRFGQHKSPAEDPVLSLVNKIMMHQVHIGGEGIVGRVAFTGIHQWINPETQMSCQTISEDEEVRHQVLAGIQTIAVIPVVPYGVVQFGSKNKVMENVGFVSQVKQLFVELGSFSECFSSSDIKMALGQKIPSTSSVGMCNSADQSSSGTFHVPSLTPFAVNNSHQQIQSSRHVNQLSNALLNRNNQNNGSAYFVRTISNASVTNSNKSCGCFSSDHPVKQPSEKEAVRAQIMLSNTEVLFNQPVPQNSCPNNNASSSSHVRSSQSSPNINNALNYEQKSTAASILGRGALHNTGKNLRSPCGVWISVDGNPSFPSDEFTSSPDLGIPPLPKNQTESCSHQIADADFFHALGILSSNSGEGKSCIQTPLASSHVCQATYSQPGEGIQRSEGTASEENTSQTLNKTLKTPFVAEGDLFDLLGLEFKMAKYSGNLDDVVVPGVDKKEENLSCDVSTCITWLDKGLPGPIEETVKGGMLESDIFAESGSDHLLDAVVSQINFTAKQNSDDNVSCKTDLTRTSSCCFHDNPSAYSKESLTEKLEGRELFGLPKALIKPEIAQLGSSKSNLIRETTGDISQCNGMYKSQNNLWVEDSQKMKHDSISSGNSKRANETVKLNRKRPRPGESARPRPKDRQMIQDRVKDLREIIPNGAKCSIDALLERTIKHMLFLQSVTKHADKLKQTGDSKIISKEGGLLLKDNFEGGATWAFEVGSQSMVCPIIVENLNGPRQMLVEMLCEERGFFLEIADIIRGLGLTILKGVMESRNDTIWARFAVEANRDVSRMDVFMSLVRLLEQNAKDNEALKFKDSGSMGASIFNQSSIPVTGSSIAAIGLVDSLC
ncbi:transcription factor LHW-like [Aristolochia californica]|uniref:transcription factor LHW-like n=1 Tax=Aristolochia californica TaxID=171875 RepID=UPI0035DE2802